MTGVPSLGERSGARVPERVEATRRQLLRLTVTATALAAFGCGSDAASSSRVRSVHEDATAQADTDVTLVAEAIAGEQSLGALAMSAYRRHPGERTILGGIVQRQRQHVARLRASVTNLRPPRPQAVPRPPRGAEAMLAAIGAAATQARDARAADCLAAVDGGLAELFASIAAAHGVTVLLTSPSTAAVTVPTPQAVTTAQPLQACLRAEQAAVFGYALVGGVLDAGVATSVPARAAVSAYDAHRDRRDLLTTLIAAAGLTPAAADPAYRPPFHVTGTAGARRLARLIEDRCAGVYAQATAETTTVARLLTSTTLQDCAVRAVQWGASPVAFPGMVAT